MLRFELQRLFKAFLSQLVIGEISRLPRLLHVCGCKAVVVDVVVRVTLKLNDVENAKFYDINAAKDLQGNDLQAWLNGRTTRDPAIFWSTQANYRGGATNIFGFKNDDIEKNKLGGDRLGQAVRNLFECLALGEEGAAISLRAGENPRSTLRP